MQCDDARRAAVRRRRRLGAARPRPRAATSTGACAARPSWCSTASCCGRCTTCAPRCSSPLPGSLADILADVEEAGERHAVRSMLSGRRVAYVGGIAAATAAGAGRRDPCSPPAPRPVACRWPVRPGSTASRPRRADAVGSQARVAAGRRPESRTVDPPRAVAQLAEHRSPKPAVGGSSPSCPASPPRPSARPRSPAMAMNRETKRMLQRQGSSARTASPTRRAPPGHRARARPEREAHHAAQFVKEVRSRAAQGRLADPGRDHQLLDHRVRRRRGPDRAHRRPRLRVRRVRPRLFNRHDRLRRHRSTTEPDEPDERRLDRRAVDDDAEADSGRRRGRRTSRPTPTSVVDVDDLLDDEEARPRPVESPYDRPGRWYVVHTQSGYEKKVKQNLEARISSMNMEERIHEVVIPMEDVVEFKNGKKVVVQKKVFPGYLLVRCDLDDDSWYVIRNTPGRHRLRRPGRQAVAAAPARRREASSRSTAERRRGRRQARQAPPRVRDRRDRAGQGGPLRRLLRRDHRDQRGPAQAQGARQHLRPGDARSSSSSAR